MLDQFQKPISCTFCFSANLLKKPPHQNFVTISFHSLRSDIFFLLRAQVELLLRKSCRQMGTRTLSREQSGLGVTQTTHFNSVPKVKTGRGYIPTSRTRILVLQCPSFNFFTMTVTLRFHGSWHQGLTLRRLMSYIYGAPILDVSRSHTTTQHSR